MQKINYLLIITLFISLTSFKLQNGKNSIKIEIIGIDGGQYGFNNVTSKCTPSNIKQVFKDSGYAKFNYCPMIKDMPEMKTVFDLFSHHIAASQPIDTTFTFSGYGIIMEVKDCGNFHLKVD